MAIVYMVQWRNPEAVGWVDIIPESVIRTTAAMRDTHEMVSKGGEVIVATFDAKPLPNGHLLLQYGGRNAPQNEAVGVFRGDTRIDPKRFSSATTLDWRDEDEQVFEQLAVEIFIGAVEGEKLTSKTTISKRSTRLKALKQALGRHAGVCEACGTKGDPRYGDAKHAAFEVHHHANPLARGIRITSLSDLSYLCANCHRVITALGEMPLPDFVKRLNAAA